MTNDIAIRYCDEYLARHISDIDKEFLKTAKEALQKESCDDCISRQAVKDLMRSLTRWCVRSEDGRFNNVGLLYDDVMFGIDRLPSGSSSEKLNKCEDAISRQAVLKIIDGWYDNNRDTENIEDLIVLITYMCSVNPQKPKSEWQQDHEILKAYSDGANAVLDKIRLDIAQEIITKDSDEYDYEAKWQNMGLRIALKVIDKYKAEGSGE